MEELKQNIFMFFGAFGICAAIISVAVSIIDSYRPVVQVDAATGECIRVISENDRYGCNMLPKKYNIEYVAPYWMRQEEDK